MSESTAGGPHTRRRDREDRDKRSFRLRRVVEHPIRLDILACLDAEPQTLSRLSARIGKDDLHVSYHVQTLESSGLVKEAGDGEEGQTLYVARLKHQPCWVARTVNGRIFERREAAD